jgi:hypothetical protein
LSSVKPNCPLSPALKAAYRKEDFKFSHSCVRTSFLFLVITYGPALPPISCQNHCR